MRCFLVFLLVVLVPGCSTSNKFLVAKSLDSPISLELSDASLSKVSEQLYVQEPRISAKTIGVLYNLNDLDSIKLARFYSDIWEVPEENLFGVSLPIEENISGKTFSSALSKLPVDQSRIRAWAITWRAPYKVEGMSVTSALSLGVDDKYFSRKGCKMTSLVSFDYKIKPSMLVFAGSISATEELIRRSADSVGTLPVGKGFLVISGDKARDIRSLDFEYTKSLLPNVDTLNAKELIGATNVILYQIGSPRLLKIGTNQFLPGALADHLTSYGGVLNGKEQMPVTEFLKLGVSASYGTVSEPCAIWSKFPRSSTLLSNYFVGDTAIESYWKSVARPGEGLFVGDPLTKPFGWKVLEGSSYMTTAFRPGKRYLVYRLVKDVLVAKRYFEVPVMGHYEFKLPQGRFAILPES